MSICGRNLPKMATRMLLSVSASHFFDELNFSSVPKEYVEIRKMNSMMIPGTITVVK